MYRYSREAALSATVSVRLMFFVFLMAGLVLFLTTAVRAEERITSFASVVEIQINGDLVVEETIDVVAEGDRIRRGIYRDFPTNYTDARGYRYKVDFSVVSVERDGRSEPFHTKKIANGVRVYMGQKDVIIPHGPHTYILRYITSRQLGFFADHDELYWNVTGNGWAFTIEQAKITVILPEAATITDYALYTGRTGAKGTAGRLVKCSPESITLETTAPLPPGSGFTVVVSWPGGIIEKPSLTRRIFWSFRDNIAIVLGFAGLLILIIYYLYTWKQVGRDPDTGPIVPRFSAPEKLSPAAGRFIMKMGFDQKSFAAVLVNMAVKGVLKIEQQDDEYTLYLLTEGLERLSPGELAVRKKLFARTKILVLESENNKDIRAAIAALKKVLRRDLVNTYFKENRRALLPGLLISLGILLTFFLNGDEMKQLAISTLLLFLVGWMVGVRNLWVQMYRAWQVVRMPGSGLAAIKMAVIQTVFFLPVAGVLFGYVFIVLANVPLAATLLLWLTVAVNFLFVWLLKAPTISGRKIMDHLEGLRMYLSVAEKERLNMFNPPEKTPKLFEQLLPWALALDVEQQWCAQFADILDQIDTAEESYQPLWYSSSHGFSSNSFSSALGGSLSISIASSSVAPGSFSGTSSGGGSSGGGGGGGGGGGW